MKPMKMSWPDSQFDYDQFHLDQTHFENLKNTIDRIIKDEVARREKQLCQIVWLLIRHFKGDEPINLCPMDLATIPDDWNLVVDTLPDSTCWRIHATVKPSTPQENPRSDLPFQQSPISPRKPDDP
jgi:hypothetical protein